MRHKLRAPIKDLLDASLDEVRVQRMWRGLQQQQPAHNPWRWAVAGALGLIVLLVCRTPDAGPLSARGADSLTFDRRHTVLSDGSRIELASDTRIALLENNGESFALRLERGRARFEVTPGGPRRWRMECGLATVTVVGTELTIERSSSELRVAVAHGIVEVRGEHVPGGLRRLTAGQSLAIAEHGLARAVKQSDHSIAAAPATLPHGEPSDAAARQPKALASAPDSQTPAHAPAAGPSATPALPKAHASRAAYVETPRAEPARAATPPRQAQTPDAASSPGQPVGVLPSTAAPPSPASPTPRVEAQTSDTRRDPAASLIEADRARERGAEAQARAILQALLREQAGSSEAAIAGFTLARMQMAQDPRAAAAALRDCLAAATPDGLREDALARLVEAYARAGEPALAISTAAEYRRKYPAGRRLAEVERWAPKP